MVDMEQRLTPEQLAELVEVPERTLGQWRYLGKGPAYLHIGRFVRYRRADVDAGSTHNASPPEVSDRDG